MLSDIHLDVATGVKKYVSTALSLRISVDGFSKLNRHTFNRMVSTPTPFYIGSFDLNVNTESAENLVSKIEAARRECQRIIMNQEALTDEELDFHIFSSEEMPFKK